MLLTRPVFRRLCRARDHLGALEEPLLSVREVAHESGISPFHFIRQFEAVFGLTPHQFRTAVRIDRAKYLLAQGQLSVTEVCLDLGLNGRLIARWPVFAICGIVGGCMPAIDLNGARIYYEDSGGPGAPVVFAHGLLWSCRLFDAQVVALKDRFRCVAFDFRGQGQSEVTESGYDLETLTADAIELIEKLRLAPAHFVGLSMGGMIGMRLAARRPELVRSLALLETSADAEPEENVPRYRRLNLVARWLGLSLVADQVMPIMFGRKFLEDPARGTERKIWRARMVANHRKGVSRAVTGVITRRPVIDELGKIRAPTLIMVGEQDVATVPAKAERIHQRIADSRLVAIPGAGHTSPVEEPAFVNAQLRSFLASHPS